MITTNPKKWRYWNDIPKLIIVDTVNSVFDPYINEKATILDDRQLMIDSLKTHGIKIKDIREHELKWLDFLKQLKKERLNKVT